MYERKITKRISVGSVAVGGGESVSVQSMCNTKTHDVDATAAQINALASAGAQIVRVAVPDMAATAAHRDKFRAPVRA